MDKNEVRVGISDYKIATPPKRLVTIGLGSCVGIALLDNKKRRAALIHIMLPYSSNFKEVLNPLKFGDLALEIAFEDLCKGGSLKEDVTAKIAGGASMFNFSDANMVSHIGRNNISSVKESLKKLSIPIISEDVGGNKGRTMRIDTESMEVKVKTIGAEIKTL